jgi:hypothetical protein
MQFGTRRAPSRDGRRWTERLNAPVLAFSYLATIVWCATILGAGLWLLQRIAI